MLGVVAAVLAAVVCKRIQLKLPTMLGPELADFSRSSRKRPSGESTKSLVATVQSAVYENGLSLATMQVKNNRMAVLI